jgi:hypothetical protein
MGAGYASCVVVLWDGVIIMGMGGHGEALWLARSFSFGCSGFKNRG